MKLIRTPENALRTLVRKPQIFIRTVLANFYPETGFGSRLGQFLSGRRIWLNFFSLDTIPELNFLRFMYHASFIWDITVICHCPESGSIIIINLRRCLHWQAPFFFPARAFSALRTVLLFSIITLNNSQSSKDIFKPKGVTSGACFRAHRNAEGGRWSNRRTGSGWAWGSARNWVPSWFSKTCTER